MLLLMKLRLLVALSLAPALSAFAEQTPQQIADAELPSLLTIYKDLHTHPELSGHEEKSSALVAKELKAAGCEVTDHVGKYENASMTGYGVVGVMKNGAGPTVLVRTDMDALPVTEETGLPYASKDTATTDDGKQVGVMQACGHDVHMSTFIGVARALAKLKEQWHGTIVFVAQPSEELGTGARALLKDGLYTRWPKPDFALGFHDKADLETGKIGVTEGYAYAAVDSVDVTVHGVGGHGAYPHKTKDPIVLSAEIINAWQTIASRENNPLDPIVVTVGSIHGGTKHNIIGNEVKMQLTVRTYKAEVRERVLAAIERIAKGEATALGFPTDKLPEVKVREDEFTPATYN
ncbi:MAG: amidohydrolase, partial [Verrucomicrobiota bacterium]|nr:amidohydrolase [Verrucomicrobiota bacterium]